MHIQLDAIGGVAGDMFVAAMLDAFPDLEEPVLAAIAAVAGRGDGPAPRCRLLPYNDGVLQGCRFSVDPGTAGKHVQRHVHRHEHAHGGHEHEGTNSEKHEHGSAGASSRAPAGHRAWSSIRGDLEAASLDDATRRAAIAIFAGLARAEAAVHGIDVEAVQFHEVGAWDSIADIVAAAHLIAHCGATSWRVGPLPLGSGRVQTAHGPLPVPAPATVRLLEGFATIDDGIPGERVTPTGAAILRFLVDGMPGSAGRQDRTLGKSGVGFGTRTLPGLSNCLRVLTYDEASASGRDAGKPSAHRELAVIEFEVDDQSAEDLAMGLDRLRDHPDIFDVVQMPVFGKKGRMMTHVRALARAAGDDAIAACFRETTTIGLRHHRVDGAALPRRAETVDVAGRAIRVKLVERPGGARTAKAEADDALGHESHADRAALRREAERLALLGDKSQ